MRIPLIGALASMVVACASIGRPEGGPRDTEPPVYVRANPAPGSTGINRPRVDIIFNENVKLEDIANKLVVSPAQAQNPAVNANGRRITIELRDTLQPNTTYTLDFADAIRDLNEETSSMDSQWTLPQAMPSIHCAYRAWFSRAATSNPPKGW